MIPLNSQVSAHSHINGIGLDIEGLPTKASSSSGYFGNKEAREAVGKLSTSIKGKKVKGALVFLSGPSGVGKSALVHALRQEIGAKIPVVTVLGAEFGDEEGPSKHDRVHRMRMALRRAVGVKMQETKKVLEGEVTELTLHEGSDANNLGELGKNISHISMTLKSAKGTRQMKFDPNIYAALRREQVQVGDIIHLEVQSGLVKRLGRCDAYKYEYDIENETYLPLPKGEVEYNREVTQEVTLHEIDFSAANPEPGSDLLSQVKCLVQNTGLNRISHTVRTHVDSFVDGLVAKGKAELIPGLLVIEDAHLMSYELYSFLFCTLQQEEKLPMVLLVGQKELLAQESALAAGVYSEFFKSCRTVPLSTLSLEELKSVIACRAKHLQVQLEEGALEVLSQAAADHTLHYAFSLFPFLKAMGKDTVTLETAKEAMSLVIPTPSLGANRMQE